MSTSKTDAEDTSVYTVVVNDEEQYSIWPEWREIPPGWKSVGVTGPKADCLSHIERVWTDMRPLSLRKAMEEAERNPKPEPPPAAEATDSEESLPVRLSRGTHPVELSVRPERTMPALLRQLETGWLHVRFTGTRGGTELGVPLEAASLEQIKTQASRGDGMVQIAGKLKLDYVNVRCVADIDLSTFAGTGQLELLEA